MATGIMVSEEGYNRTPLLLGFTHSLYMGTLDDFFNSHELTFVSEVVFDI